MFSLLITGRIVLSLGFRLYQKVYSTIYTIPNCLTLLLPGSLSFLVLYRINHTCYDDFAIFFSELELGITLVLNKGGISQYYLFLFYFGFREFCMLTLPEIWHLIIFCYYIFGHVNSEAERVGIHNKLKSHIFICLFFSILHSPWDHLTTFAVEFLMLLLSQKQQWIFREANLAEQ